MSSKAYRRTTLKPTIATALLLLAGVCNATDHIQVITHSDAASNDLTMQTLRSIFAMRKQKWADGTPIKVFVMADDAPEHLSFCVDNLKVYPYQLRRRWDRSVFSGSFHAPIQVSDVAEMRKQVLSTPGAIGYMDRHVTEVQNHRAELSDKPEVAL